MIKVGLTGNIGSGKSTVAKLFEMLGAPVFYADRESRRISEQPAVLQEIGQEFGSQVIAADGRLDRKMLGSIVFNDPQQLAVLNDIIHPRVRQAFGEWCDQNQSFPYLLHESAILFESGFHYLCDKIVAVSAPEALRIRRVVERDGLSFSEVQARMVHQWKESRLLEKADFEVVNDEMHSLIEQVGQIDVTLKKLIISS